MKRKAIYVLIVIALVAITLAWYIPSHAWSRGLMDGASGGGFGPSRRGVGVATTTWNSLSGASVDEMVIHYSSTDDARADFELALKNGGTVVQRTDDTAKDRQRAVTVIGNTSNGTSEIVTRSGVELSFVKAGALKHALNFENSVLKF